MTVLSRLVASLPDRDVENNFLQLTVSSSRITPEYNNIFVDTRTVLSDIFNNIICLYSLTGHRQLIEVNTAMILF